MENLFLFFVVVVAYLIGSFPSGLIVSSFYGKNVTQVGSGNVGATNVARVVGKKAGAIVLLVDLLKGVIAVFAAKLFVAFYLSEEPLYQATTISLTALAAVAGHCFSIPGYLKGGKGVATGVAVLLAVNWKLGLFAILVFIVSFFITRIVSLSSLAAVVLVFLIAILGILNLPLSIALALISIIIASRHHENIKRMIKGEEPRF
jgi:glycerol-3-phosphate acyltransferase PlsY